MFLISSDFWQIGKTHYKGYGDKGFGVFAKKEIKAGTVIGDYVGKVIKTAQYNLGWDKEGLFLMYFSDQASIYPDLKKPGIHLVNHSCSPNCSMYIYRGHTLFFALRKIKPAEEMTISYMLSPKDGCDPCTHDCRCNSKLCTETMHLTKAKYDKWQKFQTSQRKKTRRSKIVFGENLPKLNSYPELIPNDPMLMGT